MKTKETDAPTEFRLTVSGGRRVEEELILEIRALAQHCGLEVQSVQIVPQPKPKVAAAKSTKNKLARKKTKSAAKIRA